MEERMSEPNSKVREFSMLEEEMSQTKSKVREY